MTGQGTGLIGGVVAPPREFPLARRALVLCIVGGVILAAVAMDRFLRAGAGDSSDRTEAVGPVMRVAAPDGQIAMTNAPAEAAGLSPVAIDRPGEADVVTGSAWRGWLPDEARGLLPKWSGDRPVMFAGGRRAPGGPERLVFVFAQMIEVPAEHGVVTPVLRVRTRVFEGGYRPGNRLGMLSETPPYLPAHGAEVGGLAPRSGRAGALTVWVGEADPASSARVVMRYECDGKEGQIVGVLGADDVVEWHVERGVLDVVGE
ncbi:MAG: hypothetical protein ACAI43_03080 [Phycisphaerae bacterium]|nr:hypothetical protein [Tepidisphaeraceae bacterium]